MTLTVNKILIYKFGQCYMYLNISNEHMLVPSFTTNCKTYYKFCMDLSMQLLRQRAFSSIDPRRLEKKTSFFSHVKSTTVGILVAQTTSWMSNLSYIEEVICLPLFYVFLIIACGIRSVSVAHNLASESICLSYSESMINKE